MGKVDNRADVEPLKKMLRDGWNRISRKVPDEKVYAFGIYTNECAQSMSPFLLGEKGLQHEAEASKFTAEDLRWSTADSPYCPELFKSSYNFGGRPDVFSLPSTAMEREVRYRLTAACTALKELESEGLFGAGQGRDSITLYIEGGDVDREWIFKWAKKLNPPTVYERFVGVGQPEGNVGTFTEFGTKKVYETKQYATTRDRRLIFAATQDHLFGFDTAGDLKQLFCKPLPSKSDCAPLAGVGVSADGGLIAVIPSDHFKHGKELYIVKGAKGESLQTATLKKRPLAVAVSPAGDWIAATDQAGMLNVFGPDGSQRYSLTAHTGWPRGIAVSPDGNQLATGDAETLILWDTHDWSKRCVLTLPIDDVEFDPSGRFIAGCAQYRKDGPRAVMIVDLSSENVAREVVLEGYHIPHVRYSPKGRYLVCAMRRENDEYAGVDACALVEVETGRVVDRLKADFQQVRDFAFLPRRREIAVGVLGHTRRPLVLWKPKGWAGD